MSRYNGGVKGVRISDALGIRSLSKNRGKGNGGYVGITRRSSNLDNNVDKLSGIWRGPGAKTVSHDVTTTVDNSYYEYPPPYEQFVQTGWYTRVTGWEWNPYQNSGCSGDMWPSSGNNSMYGTLSPIYGGSLTMSWTGFGDSSTCTNWTYTIYEQTGYYQTVYPPAIYHEQIDTVTTTYTVWDFFA